MTPSAHLAGDFGGAVLPIVTREEEDFTGSPEDTGPVLDWRLMVSIMPAILDTGSGGVTVASTAERVLIVDT